MKSFRCHQVTWLLVSYASATDSAGWTNITNPDTPKFDGVVRDAGNGRWDAYMIPPFKSNHNSMVEQTADGRLHMTWLSGTKEGADGWGVVYAQLDSSQLQKGSAWSKAEPIAKESGWAMGGNSIYADDTTSVLHVYHARREAGKGETEADVWHLSSKIKADGTIKGFGDSKKVFKKPGSYTKNRVVELLDGSHLVPTYGQDKKPNYPKTELLKAGGNYDNPSAYEEVDFAKNCDNLVQPSVIRQHPGRPRLLAFFRDRKQRNIYTAFSRTDGQTWTACEPTTLPNNNAGIEAWRLKSGRIAIVYNPQTSGRDHLAISLSEDHGVTWPYTRILERDTASNGAEFSYPSVREDRNEKGVLHVSYTYLRDTIKYSKVTEDWIMKNTEETVV